jgi:uncharacterized protein
MIIGDDIFVMLLVEKFFKTFTKNEICDTSKNTEVLLALSADSREKVGPDDKESYRIWRKLI